MTTWDTQSLKAKLKASDAWVARAIFRLASDLKSIPLSTAAEVQLCNDDLLFFDNLKQFFADNGFFTDRHIAVARNKIRDPYVDYLVVIANR